MSGGLEFCDVTTAASAIQSARAVLEASKMRDLAIIAFVYEATTSHNF